MSQVEAPVQSTPPVQSLLPHATVQGIPAGHVMAPAHALAAVQSMPHVPLVHVPASQSDWQRACASTIAGASEGASPLGASCAASPASAIAASPAGASGVDVSLPPSAASFAEGASADASSPCVDPSGAGGSVTWVLLPHA